MYFPIEHPQFLTATIHEWKYLLKPDKYKSIIIESLQFLVRQKRVIIFGFVIMSNLFHVIWQIQKGNEKVAVQRDFLKFVGQQIKFNLEKNHLEVLKHFEVNKKDRKYQFWKRNALSIDLFSSEIVYQKLKYIHDNPVKAGLCQLPEEYHFSSAAFYLKNENNFYFLEHYKES
jgi:REP element-mobilizing transposase RayT